jgi:hypothetical protein
MAARAGKLAALQDQGHRLTGRDGSGTTCSKGSIGWSAPSDRLDTGASNPIPVNHLAAHDRHQRPGVADRVGRNGQDVLRQHRKIGELARLDRTREAASQDCLGHL